MTGDVRREPLPDFLHGMLSTMPLGRRAGEWDVRVPDRPPVSVARVADYLQHFRSAFSWAYFGRIAVGLAAREIRWTGADGRSIEDLLSDLESRSEECTGMEVDLDLLLSWIDGSDRSAESVLQGAAALLFDHEAPLLSLTIRPNLFTNEVYLYSERGNGVFDRTLAPFEPAASLNRRRLAHSLTVFAASVGGEIETWESELVLGVERHGFDEDARPV